MLFIAVLLRTLLISYRGDETRNTHIPSHDGVDGWMDGWMDVPKCLFLVEQIQNNKAH